MEKPKHLDALNEIVKPILEHQDQMIAIAKWIGSEFIHRDLVNPIIMGKAQKWDELKKEVEKFYPGDNDEIESDGDLCDIGEICARKLGFL